VIVGLALLTYGSDWLVHGASHIAKALGVSDLMIGMTVVTMGTTTPELTSSLVACYRGEKDIAVGNIVGSNIFNILAVLGTGGLVAPHGIAVESSMINFAMPVMIAVAAVCFPIFLAGMKIRRGEGVLFLLFFGLYTFLTKGSRARRL
jgi:cation:H+ antiporter